MQNKSAFTLIETIIAITLTTVVMTAVTGLILTTLLANERNAHTIQAELLAQEGLEALRFMRDSNWLQNYTWDAAGDLWGQDFHLDRLTPSLSLYLVPKICSGTAPCFSLSTFPEDGVVELGEGFKFTRRLDFSAIRNEDGTVIDSAMQVTAYVEWVERGSTRSVELSTNLTDWQ